MAHEMASSDYAAYFQKPAWHGLGTVVQDAKTPSEMLQLAKMNWRVEQWPLAAHAPFDHPSASGSLTVPKKVANVRSDTLEVLGIVGSDWTPVQNWELAEFCELLAGQDRAVTVESMGSIQGGRKVYCLMHMASFETRGNDTIEEYLLASNGFDGVTGFRLTPTSVRVVCSNTLHMVIPRTDRAGQATGYQGAFWSTTHSGDIKTRLREAQDAIKRFNSIAEDNEELIRCLSRQDVNSEQVQKFFLQCWSRDHGKIVENPTNEKEERRRKRAMDDFLKFDEILQRESEQFDATAWTAFNAYSEMVLHKAPRQKDPMRARESQLHGMLFGQRAERTQNAFAKAILTLAS